MRPAKKSALMPIAVISMIAVIGVLGPGAIMKIRDRIRDNNISHALENSNILTADEYLKWKNIATNRRLESLNHDEFLQIFRMLKDRSISTLDKSPSWESRIRFSTLISPFVDHKIADEDNKLLSEYMHDVLKNKDTEDNWIKRHCLMVAFKQKDISFKKQAQEYQKSSDKELRRVADSYLRSCD